MRGAPQIAWAGVFSGFPTGEGLDAAGGSPRPTLWAWLSAVNVFLGFPQGGRLGRPFPPCKSSLNIYYQKSAENASGFYAAGRRTFAAADGGLPRFLFFAHLTFPNRAPHFRYSRLFCTRRYAPPCRPPPYFSLARLFNFLHRFCRVPCG